MPNPNPEYIRELIELFNTSPFPDHMSMRLSEVALDRALLELRIDRRHLQVFGFVHGGVLAVMIDTATFWAVWMRIPEEAGLVNIDLKLNYLKPVEGGLLIAEGRAIRTGNSISYAETEVRNESRQLVAHGTSTLMTLPGKGLKLVSRKFLDS
ncbi:MAG TPA: PaaI family thioesterase [Syntrophobacteraceae bacterium]|nr:PaaI family thioesterase [Syntrophobacteraceae bacterium]